MVLKNPKHTPTEKEVENQIIDFLRLKGVFCWKNQSTGVFDPKKKVYRKINHRQLKGTSDILGILPDGRFLAIEVKKPLVNPRSDEKLFKLAADDQKFFIETINKKGGLAFVADRLSVVLEKLEGLI